MDFNKIKKFIMSFKYSKKKKDLKWSASGTRCLELDHSTQIKVALTTLWGLEVVCEMHIIQF